MYPCSSTSLKLVDFNSYIIASNVLLFKLTQQQQQQQQPRLDNIQIGRHCQTGLKCFYTRASVSHTIASVFNREFAIVTAWFIVALKPCVLPWRDIKASWGALHELEVSAVFCSHAMKLSPPPQYDTKLGGREVACHQWLGQHFAERTACVCRRKERLKGTELMVVEEIYSCTDIPANYHNEKQVILSDETGWICQGPLHINHTVKKKLPWQSRESSSTGVD